MSRPWLTDGTYVRQYVRIGPIEGVSGDFVFFRTGPGDITKVIADDILSICTPGAWKRWKLTATEAPR